jgi:hypothetical protein
MVWPHSVMSTDMAFHLLLEFPVSSYVPYGTITNKNAKERLARHRRHIDIRSIY